MNGARSTRRRCPRWVRAARRATAGSSSAYFGGMTGRGMRCGAERAQGELHRSLKGGGSGFCSQWPHVGAGEGQVGHQEKFRLGKTGAALAQIAQGGCGCVGGMSPSLQAFQNVEIRQRRTERGGPTSHNAQPFRPHRYIRPRTPPGRSAPHGRSVYSRAARTNPRGSTRPDPRRSRRLPRRGAPQAAQAAAPTPTAPSAPCLRRDSPPPGCAPPRPAPRSPPGSAVVRPGAPRLAERLKGPAGRAFPPSDAAARAPSPARRSPARRSAGPGGRGGGGASGAPPAALPWKRRTAAAEGHKGRRGGGGLRGAAPWRRR